MCSIARHMENIMLFTLLGLCVGLAAGTEGAVVKDFDISKVVTITVGQAQCFLWGLGFAQSQLSILYHVGNPLLLDLSRLLHPLERRGENDPQGPRSWMMVHLGSSFLYSLSPSF